jgi:hypothetical protein
MTNVSRSAWIFISFVIVCGLSALCYGLVQLHTQHQLPFLMLLVIALASSRFKLKLPGLNGNMSVNLPFILIAVAELSLFQALIIALVSTVAQCFSRDSGRLKMVQMLFNGSCMAVAAGLAGLVFQGRIALPAASISGSVFLTLAGATFFLMQTVPVATVIALTEGRTMLAVWSGIIHLSFPYYVISAGVASMATAASHFLGWQVPLFMLPVMYGVYRSYRLYFGQAEAVVRPSTFAKTAASC